ncbi:MAG: tetratricopeptide repeat protein [Candidatus Humimicrobiaceae bacterium]
MKKIIEIKIIRFPIFVLILALLLSLMFSLSGCSESGAVSTGTSLSEAKTSQSAAKEDISTTESINNASSSTSTTVLETTTSEHIPSEIDDMIAAADAYFNNGQYAEAVSAYRSIKPAVEKTSISDSLKEEIMAGYEENFEESKAITETARMHFGNAMQLEYEKRIDEAINELEEALKIYPKYQDARDKLDSIKSLYNLK